MPLKALLWNGQPFKLEGFTEDQTGICQSLIKAVTVAPVLALPKEMVLYIVNTDSSDYQVGCALSQTNHDGERPTIGYWSKR